ncbi:ImmA/IrrE family metallo-endopeptidase [Listeria fleischmannii]|uniref:Phage-like element PBSX protein n=1 Tax=Listeria fleischmannii FSL S10-1203 TaxID=1265822 RepID=W7DSE7_9LIST|nr:ImmA/IrrE family metallo-endopeptidase [Listeria fleischmannii]EUJ53828.1 phage-like element PBSX protein [Listeria fleischmannii FSL S10-1203]
MIKLSLLETQIQQLYDELEIDDTLDMDMYSIASKLNIRLVFWKRRSCATTISSVHHIFINTDSDVIEQWYDFAHELGHIVRHFGNQAKMPDSFLFYQEKQANNFAEHFLVPTFKLNQLVMPTSRREATRYIMSLFPASKETAKRRLKQYTLNQYEEECRSYDFM